MSLLHTIKSQWYKRQLTQPELADMFAPPPEKQWVAIDCEMSGLNPKKHHLLSIAVIHINDNTIDMGNGLHLVCRPPVMPTAETIVIHGLRPNDVEHGISYDEMLALVLPFISNRPIVGFCPQIDMAFLNPLAKQYMGTPLPNPVIDIRELYNRRTGNRTEGVSHHGQHLSQILTKYNIPDMGSHDAYNDAIMTAMAFLHLK
ncbi:3'-5' exonuclease [Psychrobacter sp. I-STPA6b]|uniref:3'-5' exonuclease n=1 Tax=Psychrobacter sp. I-STPA6b TaxID=2585718 RepID=UPI001D0C60F3|nr:3'-5' exonuclease [Psychrobacter sp. I-STPA6b]